MNRFLELQSKYTALIDRNNNRIKAITEKIETTEDYERLRLLTERVHLHVSNIDYKDFIIELKYLEGLYANK